MTLSDASRTQDAEELALAAVQANPGSQLATICRELNMTNPAQVLQVLQQHLYSQRSKRTTTPVGRARTERGDKEGSRTGAAKHVATSAPTAARGKKVGQKPTSGPSGQLAAGQKAGRATSAAGAQRKSSNKKLATEEGADQAASASGKEAETTSKLVDLPGADRQPVPKKRPADKGAPAKPPHDRDHTE